MNVFFGIILLKFSYQLKKGNVMPKFFVNSNQINNNEINIIGEDVNHIVNVLRMKKNDELQICVFDLGINYLSTIIEIDKSYVRCKIEKQIDSNSETSVNIVLFQGIPKFDKMELIIQKNTEIGVKTIIPVSMKRCIAKIKDNKKIERWNKISEIASKQSLRDMIPKVEEPKSIEELCESFSDYDLILVAYEKEKENKLKRELKLIKDKKDLKIGILIGPEGGIEESEINKLKQYEKVKIITLGNRILRTETAGLVLASNIIYELES